MPIAETSTVKYIGYLIAIGVFEYLSIEQTQIFILSILMFIDTITGIAKVHKLNKREITSYQLSAGVIKKMLVIMFLFSFALMFKGLGLDPASYIKTMLSLLMVAQFYSITQNIYSALTGIKLKEYDAIAWLIKSIGEILLKIIEDKLGKKKG